MTQINYFRLLELDNNNALVLDQWRRRDLCLSRARRRHYSQLEQCRDADRSHSAHERESGQQQSGREQRPSMLNAAASYEWTGKAAGTGTAKTRSAHHAECWASSCQVDGGRAGGRRRRRFAEHQDRLHRVDSPTDAIGSIDADTRYADPTAHRKHQVSSDVESHHRRGA